jgi:hypothetical protein
MTKNSNTSVTLASIDKFGKVDRQELFDQGSIDCKVRPFLAQRINENEMLLFGHKGLKNQRFILLRFD